MSPRAYFRGCLLLPVLVPVLAWRVGAGYGSLILVLSLVVAGIPYLVFAAGMWLALSEDRDSSVPAPILLAPFLFLPVEGVVWLAWSAYQEGIGVNILGAAFAFIAFALWTLLIGYLYVGLAVLPYLWLRRAGYIHPTHAPEAND